MNYAAQKRIPARSAAAPPRAWKPSRTAIRAAFLIGIPLLSGLAFRTPVTMSELALATDTQQPPAIVAQTEAAYVEEAFIITERPVQISHNLESVSLDQQTQEAIWEVCKENPRLFCMVMAIAWRESIFDPHAIGDNGNSLGLLQIQPRWNQDRMDKLGVTDLMDPVQNARVAVDYIDWIAELLIPEQPEDAYGTHSLLMAYNQGWAGANKSWSNGTYSTEYSRAVMGYFDTYLAELGVVE